MKTIGLTGGMATGKSTAMWMFRELGASVVNADDIAHRLLAPKTVVWKLLFERYGDRIMQKRGEIDRSALASIIFSDKDERDYVEHVMHPRIREEIVHAIVGAEKSGMAYVIIEVPLLFEAGWQREFDIVVVVRCDREQQIDRCMRKFHLTRAEAQARIAVQRPLADKVAQATYVIDNAGSKEETLVQVQRLFRKFEKGEIAAK